MKKKLGVVFVLVAIALIASIGIRPLKVGIFYPDDPQNTHEFGIKSKWVKSSKEISRGSEIYIIQRPEIVFLISEELLVEGPAYISRFYWDGREFRERNTDKKVAHRRVSWNAKSWRFSTRHVLYFFRDD